VGGCASACGAGAKVQPSYRYYHRTGHRTALVLHVLPYTLMVFAVDPSVPSDRTRDMRFFDPTWLGGYLCPFHLRGARSSH
jgi:hypothetical protein